MFCRGPARENMKNFVSLITRYVKKVCAVGGGGRILSCAQRLYYGRDQLDRPPPNGLNHNLPLNKTGANSTGERFWATMALLFDKNAGIEHAL